MSRDLSQCTVTITVTYHEARALRTAAQGRAKMREKQHQRSDFKPEPGKLSLNMEDAKLLRSAANKVDSAITKGIEAFKRLP